MMHTQFVVVQLVSGSLWIDRLCVHSEFQGPPDDAKCEAYQAQLADEGKGDLVEFVNCSALWFDKDKVGLWLISFYFVVVTLTTYVLLSWLHRTLRDPCGHALTLLLFVC